MFQNFFISLKLTGSYNDILDGSINLLKRVGIGNFPLATFRGRIQQQESSSRKFIGGNSQEKPGIFLIPQNMYQEKQLRWKNILEKEVQVEKICNIKYCLSRQNIYYKSQFRRAKNVLQKVPQVDEILIQGNSTRKIVPPHSTQKNAPRKLNLTLSIVGLAKDWKK